KNIVHVDGGVRIFDEGETRDISVSMRGVVAANTLYMQWNRNAKGNFTATWKTVHTEFQDSPSRRACVIYPPSVELLTIAQLKHLALSQERVEAETHGQAEAVARKEPRDGKPFYELTRADSEAKLSL